MHAANKVCGYEIGHEYKVVWPRCVVKFKVTIISYYVQYNHIMWNWSALGPSKVPGNNATTV